ncbi:MAG: DUF1566 domain-containing protein [Chloroflexi bacterium]|nr:DUF1566 domain-containing protein [Chloroflexota bacterium]
MHRRFGIWLLLGLLVGACVPQAQGAQPSATPILIPPFFPIPETGLRYCYDATGLVACPAAGEVMFGQDANYIGADLVYTDHGDGTLTDPITGLTWQQLQSGARLDQAQAAQTCHALDLAGYDDWRLPSIQELFSIADMSGLPGAAFFINSAFDLRYADPTGQYVDGMPFDLAGQTWSASLAADGGQAYVYNFFNGDLHTYPTDGNFFYRCVRGAVYGQNDLANNDDGTLTDTASGLVWQQADSLYDLNWDGALAYCENLSLAGYDDWRLPDSKELASLAFALDSLFISSASDTHYWSATTRADTPDEAYSLCVGSCTALNGASLGSGSLRSEPKFRDEVAPGSDKLARCVRGGARRAINGPYTVDSDLPNLVVEANAAGQLLGISAETLLNALGSTNPTDPQVQKAAFILNVEVEELRAALRAHMLEATPLPST